MQEAFHHGGWGMYPTTIVGLVLVFAAVQYARQPDQRRLAIVRNLRLLTALVSLLGFTAGVIKSLMSAGGHGEIATVVVVGIGESLNNVGLGLGLLVNAAIITTIGAVRAGSSRTANAELADPHRP
jgi:uncharacterized membrane protein YfcA